MHGSAIDVNQMQPQGKKRRMDWDALDLNESGGGSNGDIGVVEPKIPNLVESAKECERNRKNVNGGKCRIKFYLKWTSLFERFDWFSISFLTERYRLVSTSFKSIESIEWIFCLKPINWIIQLFSSFCLYQISPRCHS